LIVACAVITEVPQAVGPLADVFAYPCEILRKN